MPPEISDKEGVPVAQKCMSHIFFFFLVFGMRFYGFSFFHHLFVFIF